MSDSIDDIKIEVMEDNITSKNLNRNFEKQLQVVFQRSPTAPHLPLTPTTPFAVPAKLGRVGLSELVNHLTEEKSSRAYEFLIKNKLLRSTLQKYLDTNNLSGEAQIVLEYIEATPPPQKNKSTPHPDWISSVDATIGSGSMLISSEKKNKKQKTTEETSTESNKTIQNVSFAITGCYDNSIRIWAAPTTGYTKLPCTLAAQGIGHSGPVKDVKVIRPLINSEHQGYISSLLVSASQDRTLRLWSFEPPREGKPTKLNCKGVFHHHTGTVEVVESLFSPNREGSHFDAEADVGCVRFLSGGYDTTVAFWHNKAETRLTEEENEAIHKYRLRSLGKTKSRSIEEAELSSGKSTISQYRPVSIYSHHKEAVSSICWPFPTHAFTASYDYTVCDLDLTVGAVVKKFSSGHVPTSLDYSSYLNIIAAGQQDGKIVFWDPRESSTDPSISIKTPQSSLNASLTWVSQVKFAPHSVQSPHLLASAAYDGKVKYWDIRSTVPLHSIETKSDRLFGLDFSPVLDQSKDRIATCFSYSGGTAKTLDRISWDIPY